MDGRRARDLQGRRCYLPVEPHLPADRIAAMLSRAECELVLTEPGCSTTLERALESLPDVEALGFDEALEEDRGDGDLGVAVAPDQLAYIYFTSGSTGEPKGAMCEHAGMLNHLYAKIDDLEIHEGDVVAQVAPQSFDISLWQLVSALLVGGRTLIVEQELILDMEAFVETIADSRGERAPGGAVLSRGVALVHGGVPPPALRPALRFGHRGAGEEGALAALVRVRSRRQGDERLRAH